MDPYARLVLHILTDAIHIVSGQTRSHTQEEYEESVAFILSEKGQRWAGVLGVDLRSMLAHSDSLIELDDLLDEYPQPVQAQPVIS